MKAIPYTSFVHRQQILDNLPQGELMIEDRNINLDANGIPQTHELIIEDDPIKVAAILAQAEVL